MVSNLQCDNCNFKMGQSTCWHFGKITLAEIFKKSLWGCDHYRPWWTISTVQSRVLDTNTVLSGQDSTQSQRGSMGLNTTFKSGR